MSRVYIILCSVAIFEFYESYTYVDVYYMLCRILYFIIKCLVENFVLNFGRGSMVLLELYNFEFIKCIRFIAVFPPENL